jgi:PKD repeat protein
MTSINLTKPTMKYLIFLALNLICFLSFSQDTLMLRPGPEGKDALFDNSYPYINWGNTEKFKCMAWDVDGEAVICRGVIYFDLTAIPSNALILDARLNLFFGTFEPVYIPHSGENASYLQRIISPWEENTVDWSNQPATTSDDQVILPQSSNPEQDYTNIDVTQQIQAMVDDLQNNFGFMLRLINEYPGNCLMFASGDCQDVNKRPGLEIIYKACDPLTVDYIYQLNEQTVSFTGNSPTAVNWYWDFGDGYSSSLQNPVHFYLEKGYYDVCLEVDNDCGSVQHCETIQVCDMPETGFQCTTEGLTAYFQDTSHFAGNYFWTFGDGYYSDQSNPWHTFDTAGFYEVCLETVNVCGRDTVCQEVFVDYSGIHENPIPMFTVYPNPARVIAYIKPIAAYSGPVILYDINGIEIERQEIVCPENGSFTLDLGNAPPGNYFCRMGKWHETLIIMKWNRK